jgi:hypothetical protein
LESGAEAAKAAAQPNTSAAKVEIIFLMQSVFILFILSAISGSKSNKLFISSIIYACEPENIALAF